MPAAAGCLIVIRLCGLNGTQAGAAAHDIDDYARKLRSGDIADTLLLEGDSRPGRTGHRARAGSSRAVDHIDRRDFAFGLQKDAADFGEPPGHIFGDFALRRVG